MGGVFKKPKAPAPPPVPTPPPLPVQPIENPEEKLTEDKLRRQRAAGRSGNVVSSLSQSTTDEQTASRISKLLG